MKIEDFLNVKAFRRLNNAAIISNNGSDTI